MQRIFFQFIPVSVLLTFQILYQGLAEHNINLLNINFKNKSFHNSKDCSGLHLQGYISSWLGKTFIFIVFILMKNAFEELPNPYHNLIINSPCKTATPNKTCLERFVPPPALKSFFSKKVSSCFREETLCIFSIGKSCGGMYSLNIFQGRGLKLVTYLICQKWWLYDIIG